MNPHPAAAHQNPCLLTQKATSCSRHSKPLSTLRLVRLCRSPAQPFVDCSTHSHTRNCSVNSPHASLKLATCFDPRLLQHRHYGRNDRCEGHNLQLLRTRPLLAYTILSSLKVLHPLFYAIGRLPKRATRSPQGDKPSLAIKRRCLLVSPVRCAAPG